ncbi:MAG: rod shape-determining protein MreC [Clostridia bacterium]|jgi:rod shape-determining protein MreC|nr:rod shape-determining protein MreC [Clostridia bacterium]
MYKSKKNGAIGTIITIIILILLVILTNVNRDNLSYAEGFATSIVMPIQNAFTMLRYKITGNTEFFTNLDRLKTENEELKNRNNELEVQLRELEIIKAENAKLQEYASLTEKYQEYNTIPAYVIDRDVSNYSSNIVINVGSKQGIEKNMTVIADRGLVGHVISVTDNTAKVQVIVDSASSVSSMISTSEESIICRGSVENDKNLNATYIDTSSELLVGDSVVTSGLGGIYPKGITIGTIKQVINTSNITDRYAIIETAVDFSKLYTVLVIK